MTVIAWIVEGTWPACVDAARAHAPDDADIALLHVTAPEVPGAARGAYAGLLGRARPGRDPGTRLEHLAAASAEQLLAAAADAAGAPVHPGRALRPRRAGSRRRRRRRRPARPAPATATAPTSGRAASARPAASSSTTPPAPSCWSGPNPRPAWTTLPPVPRPPRSMIARCLTCRRRGWIVRRPASPGWDVSTDRGRKRGLRRGYAKLADSRAESGARGASEPTRPASTTRLSGEPELSYVCVLSSHGGLGGHNS